MIEEVLATMIRELYLQKGIEKFFKTHLPENLPLPIE